MCYFICASHPVCWVVSWGMGCVDMTSRTGTGEGDENPVPVSKYLSHKITDKFIELIFYGHIFEP